MLKSPTEFAALLAYCYPQDKYVEGVIDAARAHPLVPASYYAEVLSILTKGS